MNIGVVGGSGFIGSHLVDRLIEHGHEVTVFDIMKAPRDDVRHIYIDITDLSRTCVALTGAYDAVYILAAMADVNDVYQNPIEAGQINILAVANILEAARRSSIGRVILASTVWVYETAAGEEVDEDTPLIISKVKHIYTGSKIAAELYCHAYQKLYGQSFTILRYGIPYGPRAREGTVVATFVRKALSGQPLTIMGDGLQYRNFIYVTDLAEGNAAALKDIAENRTYNLEGKQSVTIKEIAETIQKILGKVSIEYVEGRPGDFSGREILSKRAKEELGWEPMVPFEEGVRSYIKWFKENQ